VGSDDDAIVEAVVAQVDVDEECCVTVVPADRARRERVEAAGAKESEPP
jgi:hypothetical protein